jgi:hypothetical protein
MMLRMKTLVPSRAVELCSEALLAVAVLVTGCGTAFVLVSLCTPLDPKTQVRFQIDVVDEVHRMAAILNVGLPAIVISLACFAALKLWLKRPQFFPLMLALAAAVSVSVCALAVWHMFVSTHPGAPLWPMVWWKFWS